MSRKKTTNKINIKDEQIMNGAIHSFEMAGRLLKSSQKLIEDGEYSIANSLLILCGEEAIKSYALFYYFGNRDQQYFNISEILKDHRPRFSFMKNLFLSIRSVNTLFKALNKIRKLKKENPKLKVNTIGKVNLEKINFDVDKGYEQEQMTRYFKEFFDTYDKKHLKEIQEWWKNADEHKQEGLYVDFKDGIWQTPNIRKSDYLKTSVFVFEILEAVLFYRGIYGMQEKLKKENPELLNKLIIDVEKLIGKPPKTL